MPYTIDISTGKIEEYVEKCCVDTHEYEDECRCCINTCWYCKEECK